MNVINSTNVSIETIEIDINCVNKLYLKHKEYVKQQKIDDRIIAKEKRKEARIEARLDARIVYRNRQREYWQQKRQRRYQEPILITMPAPETFSDRMHDFGVNVCAWLLIGIIGCSSSVVMSLFGITGFLLSFAMLLDLSACIYLKIKKSQ